MSLDDKLRKTYFALDPCPEQSICVTCTQLADEFVAEVKTAFADEGYAQNHVAGRRLTCLTGQEWRDRFGKALKENLATFVDFADMNMGAYNSGKEAAVTAALEAASRASGLPE